MVDRNLVDQYVRIADDLQIFLVLIAITGAVFFGTLVDLTMKLDHPIAAYLILAASGAATAVIGLMLKRLVGSRKSLANGLDLATMEVPVTFMIQAFAPGSTSVPTSSGFKLSGIADHEEATASNETTTETD